MVLDRSARIEGNHSILAGGNVVINAGAQTLPSATDFKTLDEYFAKEVNPSGTVMRLGTEIPFSAEALFTSLMRIGVSYRDAIEATVQVIVVLADWKSATANEEWLPTTADIRRAVMRSFVVLGNNREYDSAQVAYWSTAYIRRYGNPNNDCVKVIDADQHVDLTYEYVSTVLLPHLLSRIVGLERHENPLERYADVAFPRRTRDDMAKAIVEYARDLNMFAIRYKTLLNVLQDYILEPPHPWIVTAATTARITEYNAERAEAHHADLLRNGEEYGFEHSAKECIRHSCAAVLSAYGCFLGVDHKYGLFELKRILGLQRLSPDLWESCSLESLVPDLKAAGIDLAAYVRLLESAQNLWHSPPRESREVDLLRCATRLLEAMRGILATRASRDGSPTARSV